MWEILEEAYDLSDMSADKLERHRHLVDVALRHAFDRLGELGIVDIADELRVAGTYGGVSAAAAP